MYEWWLKFHPEIASTDIQARYDKYNELFRKARGKA
nr:MAG TPA: putative KorC regulated protein A [Caudoviricetes sp.]